MFENGSKVVGMEIYILAACFFLFGYLLNIFYITVLYHRGLTHQALVFRPWMMRVLGKTGIWITGLEPKVWACMHRLHHQNSDTLEDPHSPKFVGVWGVWVKQYFSYREILRRINLQDKKLLRIVDDIPFDISFVNRYNLSHLPYIVHGVVGLGLGLYFSSWIVGGGYFLGLMSHPIQGWMVNALAHRFGERRFAIPDDSRNNLLVSWLVFGEGLQNNHHAHPKRANFSFHWLELDLGYVLCLLGEAVGLFKIQRVEINHKH